MSFRNRGRWQFIVFHRSHIFFDLRYYKDDDLNDTDDSHSEGFVPGGRPWPALDMNESELEDGMDSVMESIFELSDCGILSEDEPSSDCTRSRMTSRSERYYFMMIK